MQGAPMQGQPMHGAPMQHMPMSTDSAFAGLAHDEMDDLFGPTGGPAAQQPKVKTVDPEKKVPKNLVGASDTPEDKNKKKNAGPVKLTTGQKALALQGIIVGLISELAGGVTLYYFYFAFKYMQEVSGKAEDAMGTYRALIPLVACIAALLMTLSFMGIAGSLAWAGMSALRGKTADIGWVKKLGLLTAAVFVLSATFYHLGLINIAIGEKDERYLTVTFEDKEVTSADLENKEFKDRMENAKDMVKESFKMDVMFQDVLYYLSLVFLFSIVPVYCAALSSYVKVIVVEVKDEFMPDMKHGGHSH